VCGFEDEFKGVEKSGFEVKVSGKYVCLD